MPPKPYWIPNNENIFIFSSSLTFLLQLLKLVLCFSKHRLWLFGCVCECFLCCFFTSLRCIRIEGAMYISTRKSVTFEENVEEIFLFIYTHGCDDDKIVNGIRCLEEESNFLYCSRRSLVAVQCWNIHPHSESKNREKFPTGCWINQPACLMRRFTLPAVEIWWCLRPTLTHITLLCLVCKVVYLHLSRSIILALEVCTKQMF